VDLPPNPGNAHPIQRQRGWLIMHEIVVSVYGLSKLIRFTLVDHTITIDVTRWKKHSFVESMLRTSELA